MLYLRADAGLAVLVLLDPSLRLALWRFGDVAAPRSDVPLHVALHAALRAPVARVGPDLFLLAVQQIGHLLDVGLAPYTQFFLTLLHELQTGARFSTLFMHASKRCSLAA